MMFYKFFPILLLFYSVFFSSFSPHPLSLSYSSFQSISSFPHYLPYPCVFSPLCSPFLLLLPLSFVLLLHLFFLSSSSSSSTPSPLPAPPPTSSLITSYKFLPLSFIFSTPSPPPQLRLTPPPTPHSLFIHSSSSSFSPFFFSHLSSFPFSHLSSLFPLPPLLLFPPPFVVSILVSLFDPSIFETGNDLVIYVRRNRKETRKIITNFEKYMYVLMFTFFTHVTLLDGLQFIKSRITFNLDRCTFELLDATNW